MQYIARLKKSPDETPLGEKDSDKIVRPVEGESRSIRRRSFCLLSHIPDNDFKIYYSCFSFFPFFSLIFDRTDVVPIGSISRLIKDQKAKALPGVYSRYESGASAYIRN